jgi:glyceraldehyde 3-phosphate dehydrogenase
MTVKVGINGFGRIGRQVLKVINEKYQGTLEVVAINDLFDTETNAYLYKYDSNYGITADTVEVDGKDLMINGKRVKVFSEKDPGNLPWKDLGVEIVIESTGVFRDKFSTDSKPGADAHIVRGGAKKVIISAPAKNEDITVVMGVNDDLYDPAKHHVVSNASCTTNCLAPALKVLHDLATVKKGVMTTIHSYTNDQKILDMAHKDARRARAAALNIIPTTTGAAKAIALVMPELKGKLDGFAMRVPTPTVSVVDFVAEVEKDVTVEEINAAWKAAAEGKMAGVLGYCDEPLVSMDFKGDPRSSIVDADLTMVMEGKMVKFVTWYDNEWGYSNRTADLAAKMAKSL